jgi:hypothetical protein
MVSQVKNNINRQQAEPCFLPVPPKRPLTFTGLHGAIHQEVEIFIVTLVRTSNPINILRGFLAKLVAINDAIFRFKYLY